MDILERDETVHFSQQVQEARRFFFPGHQSTVLSGGSERVNPQYDVHRDNVPFFAFEFVYSGRGSVTLGENTHPLRPATFFTYGPRLEHRIRTDSNKPLFKFFIDCKPAHAKRLMRLAGLQEGAVWETSRPAELMRIASDIIAAGQRQAKFADLICERLFEVLILTASATRVPPGSSGTRSFARYRSACQFIESHTGPLRSLAEVAKASGISETYLCRIFQRYDQKTPYQYLQQVQMNRAAALLRDPTARVADIARQLGFEDPFHFSRVFRRQFGISPKAYREA